MNQKQARKLRKIAKDMATVPNEIAKEHLQVKQVQTDNFIYHNYQLVREVKPLVTYTGQYVEDCLRKIYKQLKGEYNARV